VRKNGVFLASLLSISTVLSACNTNVASTFDSRVVDFQDFIDPRVKWPHSTRASRDPPIRLERRGIF
jgi:hypothetical protein